MGAGGGLANTPPSDVNGSGVVDTTDANIVQAHLGECGEATVGVGPDARSSRLWLEPPFPNPFAGRVFLSTEIPAPGAVARLEVYDIQGRRVASIHEGFIPEGRYAFEWSGRDARDVPVPAGIYFVRLTAGDREERRPVTLLRR
jgi:hypothetical protein